MVTLSSTARRVLATEWVSWFGRLKSDQTGEYLRARAPNVSPSRMFAGLSAPDLAVFSGPCPLAVALHVLPPSSPDSRPHCHDPARRCLVDSGRAAPSSARRGGARAAR